MCRPEKRSPSLDLEDAAAEKNGLLGKGDGKEEAKGDAGGGVSSAGLKVLARPPAPPPPPLFLKRTPKHPPRT